MAAMDTSHEEVVGLDVDEDRTIDLVAADGARQTVSARNAGLSKLLKVALEDPEAKEIRLSLVPNAVVLSFIVDYLAYHKGVKPEPLEYPIHSRNMRDNTKCVFDAEFCARVVARGVRVTMDITIAANYMDIVSLMELLCAAQAAELKGKTIPQIKEYFQSGMTASEVAALSAAAEAKAE